MTVTPGCHDQLKSNREVETVGKSNSTGGQAMLGERDLAEVLIFEGANAAEYGHQDRLDRAVQALDGIRTRGASARTATATAISGCLATALRSAWEGGWQPGDIVMAAERRLGGRPRDPGKAAHRC